MHAFLYNLIRSFYILILRISMFGPNLHIGRLPIFGALLAIAPSIGTICLGVWLLLKTARIWHIFGTLTCVVGSILSTRTYNHQLLA